jgi:hypothetical protein
LGAAALDRPLGSFYHHNAKVSVVPLSCRLHSKRRNFANAYAAKARGDIISCDNVKHPLVEGTMNPRAFYRQATYGIAGLMLVLLLVVACGGDEPPTPTSTLTAVPPTDAPTSLPAEQPTGVPPTGAPASAADFAVCDVYQHLVDVWPESAGQVTGSPQDVFRAIEEAGAGLMGAGPQASNPVLAGLGEGVGAAAVNFIRLDEATRPAGFPFFDESLIGGGDLRLLCQEMALGLGLNAAF